MNVTSFVHFGVYAPPTSEARLKASIGWNLVGQVTHDFLTCDCTEFSTQEFKDYETNWYFSDVIVADNEEV